MQLEHSTLFGIKHKNGKLGGWFISAYGWQKT